MIRIEKLCRDWRTFALKDISLDVGDREYVVIVGPCGSGKTLLLETIAGLYECDSGTIYMKDHEITSLPPEKRRVSLVYQQYALFPHLSVEQNIAFGLRYAGLSKAQRRERVREMVALFGIEALADRKNPNELSGGEAQKVALARALTTHPDALLLDEPLSSLDPPARERVMDLLQTLPERLGIPILHVTHDYSEAMSLASRVAVMSEGRVVQCDSVHEVFHRPKTRFVADFVGVENILNATRSGSDDRTTYRLKEGLLSVAVQDNLPDNAWLCIRPEDVQILTAQTEDPNALPATVVEVRREGFFVRVVADTPVGTVVAVTSGTQVAELALTVNSVCCLRLPMDHLHVLEQQKG